MGSRKNDSNQVGSVAKTLRVLETLAEKQEAGVTELANELGVTKGTIHNHLSTLERNRYVVKDDDGRYQLGLRFMDLAHRAKNRIPIYHLVRNEIDKLAEKSEEMALFTVEEHGEGICMYKACGSKAVQTQLYVGHQSELHHTAVGKAILSQLPDERVEEIIDRRGLKGMTDNTITEREKLFAEIEAIRERGLAFNQEETIQGLVGVGVPIKNQQNGVYGAISIIGPSKRISIDEAENELGDMLMRSANIIEINSTSV